MYSSTILSSTILFLILVFISHTIQANEASQRVIALSEECKQANIDKTINKNKGIKCQKICRAGNVRIARLPENSDAKIEEIVEVCEHLHAEAMNSNADEETDHTNPRSPKNK